MNVNWERLNKAATVATLALTTPVLLAVVTGIIYFFVSLEERLDNLERRAEAIENPMQGACAKLAERVADGYMVPSSANIDVQGLKASMTELGCIAKK